LIIEEESKGGFWANLVVPPIVSSIDQDTNRITSFSEVADDTDVGGVQTLKWWYVKQCEVLQDTTISFR
jgi:hypothetical protein